MKVHHNEEMAAVMGDRERLLEAVRIVRDVHATDAPPSTRDFAEVRRMLVRRHPDWTPEQIARTATLLITGISADYNAWTQGPLVERYARLERPHRFHSPDPVSHAQDMQTVHGIGLAAQRDTLPAHFGVATIAGLKPTAFYFGRGQRIATIGEARKGERRGQMIRWGLWPDWAADTATAERLAVIRIEALMTWSEFTPLLLRRRCIVPASAWLTQSANKSGRPVTLDTRPNGCSLFAFAAVWTGRRRQDGAWDRSVAILSQARAFNNGGHPLPVTFTNAADWTAWLDPEADELAVIDVLQRQVADGNRVQTTALTSWVRL